MERDAVIGHGAAEFLLDRLFHNSDKTSVYVCSICGLICDPPRSTRFGESTRGRKPYCRGCKNSDSPKYVEIPYAMVREAGLGRSNAPPTLIRHSHLPTHLRNYFFKSLWPCILVPDYD